MLIVTRRVALAVLALPLLANTAWADGPRVVKNAVLQIVTGDDGKDETDVFTVTVANAGGKVFERVFDAKEEIKPGTIFNLWLNKIRAVPADEVKGSKISYRIDPMGDDRWVIKSTRLTVNYETGPAERWSWGGFVLDAKSGKSAQVEFTLTDAAKAP